MNGVAAALLILVITTITGVMLFFIVQQAYKIRDIQGNIISDEQANQAHLIQLGKAVSTNQAQSDVDKTASDKIASGLAAMATDMRSDRVSLTSPVALSKPISLSTEAPSTSLTAPTDPAKWLQVTDSTGANYANLGVGSMWADSGVSMPKGACVNFGNGSSMCGDETGFVSASDPSQGTVGTGLQLTIEGAPAVDPKNRSATSLHTSFPGDSQGMNRIVGDTNMTADLLVAGNASVGHTGAIGAGLISSKTGSHVFSGIDDTLTQSSLGLGFAHLPTDSFPRTGSDVISMTRTKDSGNHVQIRGSLEVCDEGGNQCTKLGPVNPVYTGKNMYTDWT